MASHMAALMNGQCNRSFKGLDTTLIPGLLGAAALLGGRVQAPFSRERGQGQARRKGSLKGPQRVCWARKPRQILHHMGGTNTRGGGHTGGPACPAFSPAPGMPPSLLSAQEKLRNIFGIRALVPAQALAYAV